MGKRKPKRSVFKNGGDWLFWLIVVAIVIVISLSVYYRGPSSNQVQQTTTQQPTSSNQAPAQPSNATVPDVKVNVNGVNTTDSATSPVKVEVVEPNSQNSAGSNVANAKH